MISFNEIRFNVAWNIWREVAECGVFLIPFFLGTGAEAIPISALLGVVVALFLGFLMWIANRKMKSKFWLASFMSGLTLFLAVGPFVGGCREFEEVYGGTKKVWTIDNPNMSHKQFPMVIFKPFGYSSSRTVLQITTFWCFLTLGLGFHYLKYSATKIAKTKYYAENPEGEPDVVKDIEAADPTEDVAKSDEASSEELPSSPEEEPYAEESA
jgi:high-affinity iron transporter